MPDLACSCPHCSWVFIGRGPIPRHRDPLCGHPCEGSRAWVMDYIPLGLGPEGLPSPTETHELLAVARRRLLPETYGGLPLPEGTARGPQDPS